MCVCCADFPRGRIAAERKRLQRRHGVLTAAILALESIHRDDLQVELSRGCLRALAARCVNPPRRLRPVRKLALVKRGACA